LVNNYLETFGYINISVITYYEILNGLYFKDAKKQLAAFEKYVSLNKVVPPNEIIAKKSAQIFANLRSNGQLFGHNDTLIAGTAIVFDLI